jgi:hypothetical protein
MVGRNVPSLIKSLNNHPLFLHSLLTTPCFRAAIALIVRNSDTGLGASVNFAVLA